MDNVILEEYVRLLLSKATKLNALHCFNKAELSNLGGVLFNLVTNKDSGEI